MKLLSNLYLLIMAIAPHFLLYLLRLKCQLPRLMINPIFPMKLKKILRLLYEEDYAQFPCVPCSHCSRLLYPQSVKWVTRNDNVTYPLEMSLPEISLTVNLRNPTKIAVCDGCKSNSNNRTCLTLA